MAKQEDELYEEVAASALAGLSDGQLEEGRSLVEAVVNDWIEGSSEADYDEDVKIGRKELKKALKGQDPQERLLTLRQIVLVRRVNKLSARSLDLAFMVASGRTSPAEAADEARAISTQVNDLYPDVRTLQDADLMRRLSRDLADSGLESLYILDGGDGVMSIRMNNMLP
jgi:hypothetical protein